MKKPLNSTVKILRKGKFLYGCLKPMAVDHNTKRCQQRLTCRIFLACHPTIFNGYVPQVKTNNSKSITNPECSSRNVAR